MHMHTHNDNREFLQAHRSRGPSIVFATRANVTRSTWMASSTGCGRPNTTAQNRCNEYVFYPFLQRLGD